uniref:BZIP domain-containing protein n=1 Tax=Caenorhabditis tropicalis TaxID=1561998 RepID=A0A1I7TBN3_9PELO
MDRISTMDQRFGVATPYAHDKSFHQSGPLTHYPTNYMPPPNFVPTGTCDFAEDPYAFQVLDHHSDAEIHRTDEFFARGDQVKQEAADDEDDTPPPTTRRSARGARKRYQEFDDPDYDPDYEEEAFKSKQKRVREQSASSATSYQSEEALQQFVPKTKARKYRLIAEEEKGEEYRLKRQRNNDAVRKSRQKKQEKEKKNELGYQQCKKRILQLESELSAVQQERARDQEIIRDLLATRSNAPGAHHSDGFNQGASTSAAHQ